MIRIADRELIGERVIIGKIGARQMRHRQRALLLGPHVPIAPARLAVLPAMVEPADAARARRGVIEPERQRDLPAVAIGAALRPDRLAAWQRDRPRIAEPAHTAQRPEIMIERAVLLHQDHDMLDILDRAVLSRT